MPAEIIPPAAQSLRSATILVVEDDADVGDFLREIIDEETPYQTIVVHDGIRALEKAPQLWRRHHNSTHVSCCWTSGYLA